MVVDQETRMTIKTLARKGVSKRAIARQLGISERIVRYQRRRLEAGREDGRPSSSAWPPATGRPSITGSASRKRRPA